ncbi:MAG: exodeoxyribonuclease V subunit gamma [Thermoleophilia bacterium]|nr:exodeoxyribonuclease V subunit gamma [Thermoleophilia bacterium]
MATLGLSLVVGPAHAGKVALLLERFLADLDRDPWLVVPNRADVDRVERELIARRGALLAGTITTFDGLFEHVARAGGDVRRVIGPTERSLLVRRVVAGAHLDGLGTSARFTGFADALGIALGELDAGLVAPEQLDGDVAGLVAAYRAELERVGAWDREALRRHAVERLARELTAWDGRPVLAYGFEDLTGAEWSLLRALSGRADVHVSLPYEPGRAVFASLRRTAEDLVELADGRVTELAPASVRYLPPALAHLERQLFEDDGAAAPLDATIRFLEGAGRRGTLELVAQEILAITAAGTPPEEIAVVCPSLDRLRPALETVFGSFAIPAAIEARSRLAQSPPGQALLSLLRFAWLGGTRRELFRFLRTPYSGLSRQEADWLEGRLRGRAVIEGARVLEQLGQLRPGKRLIPLDVLVDGAQAPVAAVRSVAAGMLRSAHGMQAPPTGEHARRELRAHDAIASVLDELERVGETGSPVSREDVIAGLERADVRGDGAGEPGRVAVLDLMRARTRRFDVVVVVGLEQGTLPRRATPSPFLDDDARRALDERGARLLRPDAASRDRYLFYTACTRARRRLVLAREAATDEGSPREASPFWAAVRGLFDPDDVRAQTTRRPLSRLAWPLEEAPTERERLRALARVVATDPSGAEALALANGWERRLRRARRAFSRPTGVRQPAAIAVLGGRETFRVTDLERMAGCSAAWFVERHLRPGQIDQQLDARMRGSIAHVALQRFYTRLPGAVPGADRVTPANVEDAVRLMSECVDSALESGLRIDVSELARRELGESLRRDLELLVRAEAESRSTFAPRQLEVAFASYELAPGVAVSGKIDRVDVDAMSARGIVVDYKSGSAPSARQIHDEDRLQIPLYLLVLRDQLGLEPVGGVYMPVGGGRRPRGMLLDGDEKVAGFAAADYLEGDAFGAELEHARETAVALVERARQGDVRHDPRGGDCPAWCDLWRICRKERP